MLFALALSLLSVSRVAEIQVAVDWDAPPTRVASTAATVEVDVMPFLGRTREGGPFDAYAAALQNLGAEFVRFSPWFPYPRVVVPELRPPDCTPTKPATNWNSTLFDQIVSDFMLAVCGPGASLNFSCSHSVAQQLSTMPSWIYKGAYPLPAGTVPQDPWQYKGFSAYSVGIELVDESCEPMAAYVARVVAHYTRGGHSDTCGHWHPSGFFYKWSVLSVLNENEHSIGQERYTRCFDAIRAAVEKVNTDIVLAGPETVMWTGGFGYSPYFLDPKNHKDGRPPAINSNHVAFTEGGGATGEGYFPALDAFVNTTLVPLVALRDKLAPQTELVLDEFIPFNNDWCDPDGAAALFARHGDSLRRDPRSRASPRSRGCPNWQARYLRCTRGVCTVCAQWVHGGCAVGARRVRCVCARWVAVCARCGACAVCSTDRTRARPTSRSAAVRSAGALRRRASPTASARWRSSATRSSAQTSSSAGRAAAGAHGRLGPWPDSPCRGPALMSHQYCTLHSQPLIVPTARNVRPAWQAAGLVCLPSPKKTLILACRWPDNEPAVTSLDWTTGQPNAKYWTVQMLARALGAGKKSLLGAVVTAAAPPPPPPMGTQGNGTCGPTNYGGDCNVDPAGAWDARTAAGVSVGVLPAAPALHRPRARPAGPLLHPLGSAWAQPGPPPPARRARPALHRRLTLHARGAFIHQARRASST